VGLGTWFRNALGTKQAAPPPPPGPFIRIQLGVVVPSCVELAGTTTFAKEAVSALADRKSLGHRGYYEGPAQLQMGRDNDVDPHAVAVIVEGEKVGSLPSSVAMAIKLAPEASRRVRYQLHIRRGAKLSAKAYVWLGEGPPEWIHTQIKPPGLTTDERGAQQHDALRSMVRGALAGGGARAQEFRNGMVKGVHYLELVEPIKQLKREGRLQEALVLCYQAIEGAENAAGGDAPAPGYTIDAAIIHRKLSQKDEEIAVLKRYLAKCPEARSGGAVAERLAKLEGPAG